MTEINDHVKLLYARAALLYWRHCGREVRRADAIMQTILNAAAARSTDTQFTGTPESLHRLQQALRARAPRVRDDLSEPSR